MPRNHSGNKILRYISHAVAAIILMVTAAVVLDSCSGCGRKSNTNGSAATDSVPSRLPEAILNDTAGHDTQALHSYAAAVGGNATFDPSDMASMIVLSEGSLQHLQQIVESLQRNEDPADSFNVLTELSTASWTADLATVITFLRSVPFSGTMRIRTDALTTQTARINTQLHDIELAQLGGRHIFSLDIK